MKMKKMDDSDGSRYTGGELGCLLRRNNDGRNGSGGCRVEG